MYENQNRWLKSRGYLHVTPQIDVWSRRSELKSKLSDSDFVAHYAFYPLIHSVIKERRYKLCSENGDRGHSFTENGKIVSSAKNRPLHYASHMDALIFGYYAEKLLDRYEQKLSQDRILSDSIIAYRRIPVGEVGKNKSTIHFAKEVFDEVKKRCNDSCVVIKLDIKSFFNEMDHDFLKKVWAKILDVERLPKDHFNVFKGATRFSYILKDDLRIREHSRGRRPGFDEKKIAKIRNKYGIHSFFESSREFREAIKSGELKLHRFPFRKDRIPIGIPQGLPISAVLGNIYLMEFDKAVIEEIVRRYEGFYRRYSDDIVVLVKKEQAEASKKFIFDLITQSKLVISKEKTETYLFERDILIDRGYRITCKKEQNNGTWTTAPLTYLGFEFYGHKTLLKSSNLSKFYRRMIYSVKTKAKRALALAEKTHSRPVIFYRQLFRLYAHIDLNKTKFYTRRKVFTRNANGEFRLKSIPEEKRRRANYLSYVQRVSKIMEEPRITRQVRKHKRILYESVNKFLSKEHMHRQIL